MEHVGATVRDWVTEAGISLRRVSRRTGMSSSTVSRVLGDKTDPSFSTLREIALACGLEVELSARPSSNPSAARAARAMLEPDYLSDDPKLDEWADRLVRFAEDDSPVSLMVTAARYASPLLRSDTALFKGDIPMGHLASVCDATEGDCVVSGAAGLTLPDTYAVAPLTTILWSSNAGHTKRLVNSSALEVTDRAARATVAVVQADPALFTNSFREGIVTYAAPIQIMLDCLALRGAVADAALEEIASW